MRDTIRPPTLCKAVQSKLHAVDDLRVFLQAGKLENGGRRVTRLSDLNEAMRENRRRLWKNQEFWRSTKCFRVEYLNCEIFSLSGGCASARHVATPPITVRVLPRSVFTSPFSRIHYKYRLWLQLPRGRKGSMVSSRH